MRFTLIFRLAKFSAVIAALAIVAAIDNDDNVPPPSPDECQIGKQWVEKRVKLECFEDDQNRFGVRAVACVPSNSSDDEVKAGEIWINENVKFLCEKDGPYDMVFKPIACIAPTEAMDEIAVGSSFAVPFRGIFECVSKENGTSAMRVLHPGCVHGGELHPFKSSWITPGGTTRLTCLLSGNGSYAVKATACVTPRRLVIDVGQKLEMRGFSLQCNSDEKNAEAAGFAQVVENGPTADDASSSSSYDVESATIGTGTGISVTPPPPPPPSTSALSDSTKPEEAAVASTNEQDLEGSTWPDSNSGDGVVVVIHEELHQCVDAHPEACRLLCSSSCSTTSLPNWKKASADGDYDYDYERIFRMHIAKNGVTSVERSEHVRSNGNGPPSSADQQCLIARATLSEHLIKALCPRACRVCGKHIDTESLARCYVENTCKLMTKKTNS